MTQPISVLVVDDEVSILNALKRVFFDERFGLYTTSDPQEARQIIGTAGIKVILCDHRMPGISGVDFLREIKESYPEVIRILFTGFADVTVAEQAINEGEVYRFISKPWNDEDLRGTVRQAIEKFDFREERRKLAEHINQQNEELVLLNQKLRDTYNAQKDFTSMVSHELRTPLASIKTAIEIVAKGTAGEVSPGQKDLLLRANANVDRLNRLIDEVLDLSKLQSGKMLLKLKESDLNEIIREVTDLQRPVAEKNNLYLKTDLATEMPKVVVDPDKIEQVLNNLINNAIKFTRQGGITVTSRRDEDHNRIRVEIRDTGEGIRRQDLPLLFTRFQQLASSSKNISGTGLGLAICKEILAQQGSDIGVESEIGRGSCFYFTLPVEDKRNQ